MNRFQNQRPRIEIKPNTRLFILGGKNLTDADWRQNFEQYGDIEHISLLKDRITGEQKGVTYITYSKPSEAFLAMEKMNGERICDLPKSIKVVMASDKQDGSLSRDMLDEEAKFTRIFIKLKYEQKEQDIEDKFAQFGEIEKIHILTDKSTSKSKGLAFVHYRNPYAAALALEGADPVYKAIYATSNRKRPNENMGDHGRDMPSQRRREQDDGFRGPMMSNPDPRRGPVMSNPDPRDLMMGYGDGSQERCLEIMVPRDLPHMHLRRLVDLVPGMDYCEMDPRSGIATIQYVSPAAAAYAKEKLSGFEYPLGQKLGVRYPQTRDAPSYGAPAGRSSFGADPYDTQRPGSFGAGRPEPPNLQTLVHTLKQATSALAAAGIRY